MNFPIETLIPNESHLTPKVKNQTNKINIIDVFSERRHLKEIHINNLL